MLGLGLCLSVVSFGQGASSAQELSTTPPVLDQNTKPTPQNEAPTPATSFYTPGKIQYQFSTGAQFSRFGSATYFQPSILFPVTKRFSTFANVNFIYSYGSTFGRRLSDSEFIGVNSNQEQLHSLVQVGGNYIVNEKLNLTGSVWRDFSKQTAFKNMPINVFSPGGTQGMQLRANYKVTNNLSVSGGFRYSNGNNFYNPLYQNYVPWDL